jgi:hypothetical protein
MFHFNHMNFEIQYARGLEIFNIRFFLVYTEVFWFEIITYQPKILAHYAISAMKVKELIVMLSSIHHFMNNK